MELLDWLVDVDRLIVCDAMAGELPPGTWGTWTWPAAQFERAPGRGTHDVSLATALALAAELGRLPARVEIWAIAIDSTRPLDEVSPAVAAAAPRVAAEICGALCHA
jgi:hydrogenase maturation protease